MGHERDREAEMKARGIAHRGVAGGQVGVDRKWRLHESECGDDDTPDTLNRIERQAAVMALDQPAHHLGFARRPKSRAALLGLFHLDQPIDRFAAFDQKRVHGRVDAVDLVPQVGERRLVLARRFGHRSRYRFPAMPELDSARSA